MATVTISGVDYDTYASVADGDAYFAADINGDTWRIADAETKARALVTATRWIDAQCWQGDKLDPLQPLAFPRTIGSEAAIAQASIMLAGLLVVDPALWDTLSGATVAADGGTKRLKAGSVEIEYFRKLNFSVWSSGAVGIFPRNIMAMIGEWLCAATGGGMGLAGAVSFDTCRPTGFRPNRFGVIEGF